MRLTFKQMVWESGLKRSENNRSLYSFAQDELASNNLFAILPHCYICCLLCSISPHAKSHKERLFFSFTNKMHLMNFSTQMGWGVGSTGLGSKTKMNIFAALVLQK